MVQLSNIDRKTVVIRCPRKYRFLVKAFICWLKIFPDKEMLWNVETLVEELYEGGKKNPTSPYFTNVVGKKMDKFLTRLKETE